MADMTSGYPFVFVMNDRSVSDDVLEYALQYRFKSSRSHHTYIVRVEKYVDHAYCVKFFDKALIDSKHKFSLRTNTFEPRTIFYTIIHILLDVLNKDQHASFFFIGAEDERDEGGQSTRRYRVYRRFVLSTISNNLFEHYRVNDLSLYILANKGYVTDMGSYVRRIEQAVRKALA